MGDKCWVMRGCEAVKEERDVEVKERGIEKQSKDKSARVREENCQD